jgi:hypothetical protein
MNPQEATRYRTRHIGMIDQKAQSSSPVDVARSGTATANAYWDTNTPAMTIDGNAGTYWNCNVTGIAAWLKVDLGASLSVRAFRLYQYDPYYATLWVIQASEDDANWQDIYLGATASATVDTGKVNWPDNVTHTARYFRILPLTLATGAAWDIFTFELWDS